MLPDVSSLLFAQLATILVCTLLLLLLWWTKHKRYEGLPLFAGSFAATCVALALIGFRPFLPVWVSFLLSNSILVLSAWAALVGAQRFLGLRRSQWPNLIIFLHFVPSFGYFVWVRPDLALRTSLLSFVLALYWVQAALSILRWAPQHLRAIARPVGFTFAFGCVLALIRIANTIIAPEEYTEFFRGGSFERIVLWAFALCYLFLAITLTMMVNRRLVYESQREAIKFSTIFNSSPEAIALLDLKDGRIIDVNQSFVALSGMTYEEALQRRSEELGVWADDTHRQALRTQLLREGRLQGVECPFVTRRDETLTCLVSAELLELDGEQQVLASILDISERKRQEEHLSQMNRGLEQLTRAAMALGTCTQPDQLHTEIVSQLKRLCQGRAAAFSLYDPEQRALQLCQLEMAPEDRIALEQLLEGRRLEALHFPLSVTQLDALRQQPVQLLDSLAAAGSGVLRAEQPLPNLQHFLAIGRLASSPAFLGVAYLLDDTLYGGSVVALSDAAAKPQLELVESFAQIVAQNLRRLRAEAARQAERDKLEVILDAAPLPILIVDDETRVQGANQAAAQLMELSVGQRLGDRSSGKDELDTLLLDSVNRARQGEQVRSLPLEATVDQGAQHFLLHAKPIPYSANVVLALAEVTELKKALAERAELQSSLSQSERLASMGMLAAGIAHEINNPLSYVIFNLQECVEAFEREAQVFSSERKRSDWLARMREALQGSERIKAISQSLGAFARAERNEMQATDPLESLELALNMSSNELKHRAQLVKKLQPLPLVLGSAGKLAQVFLNVLINAAQAIPEGDAERNRVVVRSYSDERWVRIEITDSGVGIPVEARERIFEPFYSTKQLGVGTGLGLAVCAKIVKDFDGHIAFDSVEGRGTRFVLSFPRLDAAAPSEEAAAPTPVAQNNTRGRILIIDDEAPLRNALKRILGKQHELVVLSTGREAQRLLAEDQDFDLILSDVMMPELTGIQLHEWLWTQDAKLAERMVFLTGGAFAPGAAEYLAKTGNTTLYKPIDADAISAFCAQRVKARRGKRRTQGAA
ncbi:MAG: ATP-binding protein [Myxococcota bacterium]|jgi:PAS domain S-box-containing protein|nr:ATP-binding protein [Myxococcota bacterium]